MSQMKVTTSPSVVIGDIVGSRAADDRQRVHDHLVAALETVRSLVPPERGMRVTVGDELQGVYATLGEALDAAFLLRLHCLPEFDVRLGIGRGGVTVLEEARGIEDGPGWWAARDAVEAAEESAARAATRTLRTVYRSAEADPLQDAVNAALLCRDHLVGSVSDRSVRLLRGLMEPDTTQAELAAREGISASAVSQRVRADGLGSVLEAQELLRGLP
jgi:SatD family (SatD)